MQSSFSIGVIREVPKFGTTELVISTPKAINKYIYLSIIKRKKINYIIYLQIKILDANIIYMAGAIKCIFRIIWRWISMGR